MNDTIERRNFSAVSKLSLRAADADTTPMVLEGYALKFESPARHKIGSGYYVETIKRGALAKCDMKDVVLRYNHNDTWLVMARTRNKSLKLTVDSVGLFIHAELIDTTTNKDVYRSVKAGLLDKMSFAFTIAAGGDSVRYDENTKTQYRDINAIDRLYDVAVVDVPFYDSSEVHSGKGSNTRNAGNNEDLELRRRKALSVLNLQIMIEKG